MRKRRPQIGAVLALVAAAGVLSGQTQVDLSTQSKKVDFTGAPSTQPVRIGTALPPVCKVGELFFNTAAAAGANIFACIAANSWVLESGGGSGGALTVKADDTVVGTRPMIDYVSGIGILNALSDNGTQILLQQSADTSVLLTKGAAQSGAAFLCGSASASGTTYTCQLTPTLTTYTAGMVLSWIPDVNGLGGATTLNIDLLGSKAIKLGDGVTNPTALDIVAGALYPLWYDGTVFRLLASAPVAASTGVVQPTCDVTLRGRLWLVAGAAGVADALQACVKDVADHYVWTGLF